MTKRLDPLEPQRDEFIAEFEAIEDQIAHACAELGRLMHSYRLNVGQLADAQAHALASTKALRAVAAGITPGAAHPAKATRPQDCPSSLAQQLADQRTAVVQTLALVQHMPGVNRESVARSSQVTANILRRMEQEARDHQPAKARA